MATIVRCKMKAWITQTMANLRVSQGYRKRSRVSMKSWNPKYKTLRSGCGVLVVKNTNGEPSNHKHIADTTQSFILRAPGSKMSWSLESGILHFCAVETYRNIYRDVPYVGDTCDKQWQARYFVFYYHSNFQVSGCLARLAKLLLSEFWLILNTRSYISYKNTKTVDSARKMPFEMKNKLKIKNIKKTLHISEDRVRKSVPGSVCLCSSLLETTIQKLFEEIISQIK